MLLGRENNDIDLVVDGSAVDFARVYWRLCREPCVARDLELPPDVAKRNSI